MTDTAAPAIAILGTGSMGGAILAGLTRDGGASDGPVVVTTRSAASAARLAGPGVDARSLEEDAGANRAAAAGADIVLLGVKPYLIDELLEDIAGSLRPGATVVSLAAGIGTERMERALPAGVAAVRSMPNTPSTVGRGLTGLAAGASAGAADLDRAADLFRSVGEVLVVGEDRIDALSAFSGSGPATVFLLIEELERAAVAHGFSAEEAATLVRTTVAGSVALLEAADEDPAELRRRVTSPNGTTERIVETLQGAGLAGLFERAAAAAVARAREIADE